MVTVEDVIELLTAWAPVEPSVATALGELDADTVMRAVTAAVADLLGSVESAGDADLSAAILVDRAIALARAGQMSAAADLAAPAASEAGLPTRARVALVRTAALAYTSEARIDEVERLIATLDVHGLPEAVVTRLESNRRFGRVLLGDPVARSEALAADVSGPIDELGTLPTVMKAISAMLAGAGEEAVAWADRGAEGFRQLAATQRDALASADVWPALFRLFTFGRHEAAAQLQRDRASSGGDPQVWADPYRQSNAATVAMWSGDIDDAAAEFDAAIDAARHRGQAWISWAVGMAARLDVARGRAEDARRRLEQARSDGLPDSLGLRIIDLVQAEVELAGPTDPSAARAHLERSWSSAGDDANVLWALLAGLDHARLAPHAGLDPTPMLEHVAGLAAPAAFAHVPTFARGWLDADVDALAAAVEQCRSIASAHDAARLGVDAAVCASVLDPAAAKRLATRAVSDLRELGFEGDERRAIAELRASGVRLGVRGPRARPSHGWDALTPTEVRVVELVVSGASGPEIGQTLFISNRTVQTHVSHALAKVGVANRLELVAAYASRPT